MDLATVQQVVEAACAAFGNPATHAEAERTLQQFRASPSPYQACQHILEHSSDISAQFQAILALRDAALREWTGLPPQMRNDLLRFLLHASIVKFSADQQPLARQQSAAAAATLLKRSWGELTIQQRSTTLSEIESLAAQTGTPESRRSSMDVLTAIILEFSPSTSSSLGLPWDYHEKSKQELQEGFLVGFLNHALNIARQSTASALSNTDGGTCISSLNLLSALLNWSYSDPTINNCIDANSAWNGDPRLVMNDSSSSSVQVKPPPSWRDILLADDALSWLDTLAAGVYSNSQLRGSPLGRGVRQLLVQLCLMTGEIFVKESGIDRQQLLNLSSNGSGGGNALGQYTRGRHLARIFKILLPTTTLRDDEESMLDTSRAFLAAASAHRLSGFLEASIGIDGGANALFGGLSELTVALLASNDDPLTEEFSDILLEMWVELCVDPCIGARAGSQTVISPAANVFIATMHRELAKAASSAWEDEAEYEGGEEAHSEAWLEGLAAIGRAACSLVLPALAQKLQECQAHLEAVMAQNQDPSAQLEQLCWVCNMCSHVLADTGGGETPLIPVAINEACLAAATTGQPDPAVALADKLLALGAVCQQHASSGSVISPRLMGEVCAALGRWAETYLYPENLSPPLPASQGTLPLSRFSDPGEAGKVADGLVRLATASLTQYQGDTTLHRAACMKLLAPLLRRQSTCGIVVQCSSWQELCAATASRAQGIQSLEAGVQRWLLQCLLHAAVGFSSHDQVMTDYCNSLLHPLSHSLQSLSQEQRSLLQRADKANLALSLVQSLRGAARGVAPSTHRSIYSHLHAVQPALLSLLTVYQSQPAVYGQILKLAADLVEYHAPMLSAEKARHLFHWAVQMVGTYASHRSTATSSTESIQLEEERAALCALLRLLTQLTNAEASDESDVAAAVFQGLDQIIPSISMEHLKFPKLRSAFFGLLSHALEAHSERVAELPPNTFSALMSALCFGIGVQDDTETEAAVFEAAAALAKYHLTCTKAGQPGLGHLNSVTTAAAPGTRQQTTTALGGVLQALLKRVLIEDPGFEAVDYAAEAALPLLLSEPQAAEQSMASLIALLGSDEAAVGSATTAFQELAKSANSVTGLDRQNRRQFSAVFRRFVLEIRGSCRRTLIAK